MRPLAVSAFLVRFCIILLIAATSGTFVSGCRKRPIAVAAATKPKAPPTLNEIDLKASKANEAGAIMMVMYHRFESSKPDGYKDMNRRPDTFRKDLETLAKKNYYPVTVGEIIDNRMDVPAGKTPIALTFDDAWDSQFKIITGADGKEHIDPNCAVGIMETFTKQHPGQWAQKATFFVLPHEKPNGDPFGQPGLEGEKLDYLLTHGCEVENHTSTHGAMRGMASERIQWEIGTAVKDIKAVDKRAQMDILAVPYGSRPRSKALWRYLENGQSGGSTYHMKGVVMAAWRPFFSPIVGKKGAHSFEIRGGPREFNAYDLERVKPNPKEANKSGTLEYWLKYFDENPGVRYVSDGNPDVCAVPRAYASFVDAAKVRQYGKTLQIYPAAGGKTGGGSGSGSGLSVQ